MSKNRVLSMIKNAVEKVGSVAAKAFAAIFTPIKDAALALIKPVIETAKTSTVGNLVSGAIALVALGGLLILSIKKVIGLLKNHKKHSSQTAETVMEAAANVNRKNPTEEQKAQGDSIKDKVKRTVNKDQNINQPDPRFDYTEKDITPAMRKIIDEMIKEREDEKREAELAAKRDKERERQIYEEEKARRRKHTNIGMTQKELFARIDELNAAKEESSRKIDACLDLLQDIVDDRKPSKRKMRDFDEDDYERRPKKRRVDESEEGYDREYPFKIPKLKNDFVPARDWNKNTIRIFEYFYDHYTTARVHYNSNGTPKVPTTKTMPRIYRHWLEAYNSGKKKTLKTKYRDFLMVPSTLADGSEGITALFCNVPVFYMKNFD